MGITANCGGLVAVPPWQPEEEHLAARIGATLVSNRGRRLSVPPSGTGSGEPPTPPVPPVSPAPPLPALPLPAAPPLPAVPPGSPETMQPANQKPIEATTANGRVRMATRPAGEGGAKGLPGRSPS